MKGERNKRSGGRLGASFLLLVFGLSIVVPSLLLAPRPAQAQFSVPITDTQTTVVNVWNTLKDQFVEGAVSALVNGANYFLSKLAYEAAVALTSDCPGQVVCWDTSGFKEGLEDAWQGAVGEMVGTLSEEGGFSDLGLNLCQPSQPEISMNIQLGILNEVEPPEPSCDFNALADNWENWADQLTSEETLRGMMPAFEPGQGSLSVSLEVLGLEIDESTRAREEAALKKIAESGSGGFSDIIDPVSGRILSPGAVTQKGFEKMETEKDEAPRESQQQMSAGQIAKGAVLSVVINTVQTFVQTFVSRLFNKFTSGILTAEEAITAQPDIILSEEGLFRPPGKSTAREALTRLLVSPPKDIGVIDPLLNFGVCPPSGRGPDNCVADAQLINAVRVAGATPFTVRQALDEGYLHGDWPLVSSNDAGRDQDPFCYTYAYCESNLKKLRAVRVIPIGWEIAAHEAPIGSASIRLQDVVNGFDDCNEAGERDDDHPFCRLIDPDWVLKAPPAQCRAQVYGSQLVSPEIPQRQEQCVDTRTCLAQDDLGNCVGGWGYCVREKNVWRFNGDICPEYYNSCLTLNPAKGGSPVNYVMNTVEFGVCNADNVGCRQYATTLNVVSCDRSIACADAGGCTESCDVASGDDSCFTATAECRAATVCDDPEGCTVGCTVQDGQTSCSTLTGLDSDDSDDWLELPARFFSDNVETCNARDNGCTSLVPLNPGQSLNFVENGSFENLGGGIPTGWLAPTAASAPDATDNGYIVDDPDLAIDGSRIANLAGSATGRLVYGPVPTRPNKLHTVSAALREDSGNPAPVGWLVRIAFFDESGIQQDPGAWSSFGTFSEYLAKYDTSLPGGANPCRELASGTIECTVQYAAGDFESGELPEELRAGISFLVTGPDIVYSTLEFSGAAAYMDAVQFEEGPLTPYHTGYNAGRNLNVKIAPEYLGCTGEAGDRPECASFAMMCRETEVGCERYTPTNGDPAVPGIVNDGDYCPAECAGYDTFFQEETDFEAASLDPEYFIPSTATQCTSADAGCTAFTNVETEDVETYAHLRLCLHEDEGTVETFYTWEGSDTTGYQLRAWSLQRTEGTTSLNDSDICEDLPCAGGTGYAPCVKLATDDPNTCVDDPVDAADREGFCTPEDIENGDFDCREFYDSDGNRHYRRLSKTVIASPDCRFYRLSGRTQEDCRKGNGVYDSTLRECIYRASPGWSDACPSSAAGCRAYRGNAASNVQTLFVEDFEGVTDWRVGAHDGAQLVEPSNESLVVGGHSAFVEGPGPNQHIWGYFDLQDVSDASYTVSFWARGNGQLDVFAATIGYACLEDCTGSATACTCTDPYGNSCDVPAGGQWCFSTDAATLSGGSVYFSDGNPATAAPPVDLTPDWQLYQLGPVRLTVDDPGAIALSIHADAGADNFAYVDNIVFKRTRDNIYVVRDSWNTPDSCDRTMDGVYSPYEMLGCREYRDTSNTLTYLRSISQLCRDNAVGCEAYSNTQNTSDTVRYRTYGAVCSLGRVCGDDPGDTGPNCPCDYTPPSLGAYAQPDVTSACRVAIGESECRFTYEGVDAQGDAADYPDRFTLPADERIYLVAADDKQCPATSVGCRTMGSPEIQYERRCTLDDKCEAGGAGWDAATGTCSCRDDLSGESCGVAEGQDKCVISLDDGIIGAWRAIAFRDDPANYDQSLCDTEAVGCEAYSGAGGTFYFKDPGNQVCEFKTNVKYEGATVSGWFRKSALGGVFPCYDTLIEGGETYGIYRNGDEGYAGWVGLCRAEYDRCEEFVDPLDTSDINPEGKPYYYLNNNKLDRSGCQGQASLVQGCVLLDQTSNTQKYFSASASYFRSDYERNGGLITPIDCDPNDPRRSALCDQRCFKVSDGVCSDDTDRECTQDSDCPGAANTCLGADTWGMGCTEDAHCDQAAGEVCRAPAAAERAAITGNDANLVLQVRRDRECAEWLECQSVIPTYDSNQGKWIQRCANFGLCDDNMEIGDSYVCSSFKQAPKDILTIDDYVSRDTTWRGLEYSGYSLIGRYPSQYLQSFKVTKGVCRNAAGENETDAGGDPLFCVDSDNCGAGYTCTSPLPGICVGDGPTAGQPCEVTDLPSEPDEEEANLVECRGDDYCSQSEFDTTRFGIRLSLCSGAEGVGCSDNEYCEDTVGPASSCVTSCGSDSDCPSDGFGYSLCEGGDNDGLRCSSAAGCPGGSCEAIGGSCLRGVCVYDYYGGPLDTASRTSAPACRAYPEKDSPFPREVLDMNADTVNEDDTPGYDIHGEPTIMKTGFSGANVCYEGNNCECTYKRVSYGASQGNVRFHSADGTISYRDTDLNAAGNEVRVEDMVPGYARHICVGGPRDGRPCEPGSAAADCNEGDGGTGVCTKVGSVTNALGWPGFCVDVDRSLTLYGEANIPGCNLWLPVDIIPGMTDMFSQAPEAGFGAAYDDLTYCSLARGVGEFGSCVGQASQQCTIGGDECDEYGGDAVDWGPCNPYYKIIQADEDFGQPAGSTGENHAGDSDYDSSGTSLKWFDNRDYDHDGNRSYGFDEDPAEDVSRDEISQIYVQIGTEADKKVIILNENNDFLFASHFDGEIPTGDDKSFEFDGVTYLKNEVSADAYNCANMFTDSFDNKECLYCSGERDSCDGRSDLPTTGENIRYTIDGERFANCIALRALFDSDGTYDRVEWNMCSHRRPGDPYRDYDVVHNIRVLGAHIQTREICTMVSTVQEGDNRNVAWTDKLYDLRNGGEVTGFPQADSLSGHYFQATYIPSLIESGADHTPFGKVSEPPGGAIVNLAYPVSVVGAASSDEEGWVTSAGSPYYTPAVVDSDAETVEYPEIDPGTGYAAVAGLPLLCIGPCRVPDNAVDDFVSDFGGGGGGGVEAEAIARLADLFAVVYRSYAWVGRVGQPTGHYIYQLGYENFDVREANLPGSDSPAIRAVSTAFCSGNGDVCQELFTEGISIDGTTQNRCYPGGSAVNVQLQYYAFADSDHMPIRRKIVDFGDGSPPVVQEGSFKNHRGLDTRGDEICGSDENDFGLSGDACDNRFFREQKTFTCSQAFADTLPLCDGTEYPCRSAAGCCEFKPRVQILDNWGVCNGTCPGGPGGAGTLCFNSGSAPGYLTGGSPSSASNECTLLTETTNDYNDVNTSLVGNQRPWTEGPTVTVCPGGCP